MKILIVHNSYQQPGGEDVARDAEVRLLRRAGHAVLEYSRSNAEISDGSVLVQLSLASETAWSRHTYRALRGLLRKEKPNVAHFHNVFPLISPSAYYACADAGVSVVQTLHNYRLLCPAATFFRDGRSCQQCLGRNFGWPGILHACYRNSRPASAVTAAMFAAHRAMNTWNKKVAFYIALSEFARNKFVVGGLPAGKILVKPNFVEHDPASKPPAGHYALFLGRLSEEKGIRVLLSAWRQFPAKIPLRIAGDGPLRQEILKQLPQNGSRPPVEWLGPVPRSQVPELMRHARFLIVPSICYENFPLVIAEAFACGLPVLASRLGACAEIVENSVTGLHFSPGNVADLAEKVAWAWTHPRELADMGGRARSEYEAKYNAAAALRHLEAIYERALSASSRSSVHNAALSPTPFGSEARPLAIHRDEMD